jgi:putative ABC transport system ATP-binding protein
VTALADISVTVPSGSLVALAGPSGSGKTTLLALIGGLDRPTTGTVDIQGLELSGLSERRLAAFRRNHVGFVFQDFKLIDVLTAAENVALPLRVNRIPSRLARMQSLKALSAVGMEHRVDFRPCALSGGEKQRVAIARALAGSPSLLLADEPTANLDTKAGLRLIDQIQTIAQTRGTTVLIASHDPRVAAKADRVLHLLDGRLSVPNKVEVVA